MRERLETHTAPPLPPRADGARSRARRALDPPSQSSMRTITSADPRRRRRDTSARVRVAGRSRTSGRLVALMEECNVETIVNLDGYWGSTLEANLDRYDRSILVGL